MNAKQRQLYNHLLDNPPARQARAPNSYFWAGWDGVGGVRKGSPMTLARAAWYAGQYAYRHEPYRSKAKAAENALFPRIGKEV
jgi:hypothetical protein